MLKKIVEYLMENPEEALAIVQGKAMPIGLTNSEILELIRTFSVSDIAMTMGYWS